MGLFIESTGCGENTTNGIGKDGRLVKIPLQSGVNLHYNGTNLPGTGVQTCDTVNIALKKMDAVILELRQKVFDLEQTLNQLT